MRIREKITHFKRESKGASMVEFALLLPLMMTISLGIYETTNYVMLSAKLEEIASGVANWVSTKTTAAKIADCFIGANLLGKDYNFSAKGAVVVSGLQQIPLTTTQQLIWQQASSRGISDINTTGLGIVTSTPFSIASVPNLIVVEVTYQYQPIFSYFLGIFPTIILLKVGQMIPRGTGTFNPLPPY